MKVEKISDTQVKFFLNQSDLVERDINMAELAFGSEKAHALFREMMNEASCQCGFDFENSPIMIEAVSLSTESIMIVVTKISNMDEIEDKLSLPHRRGQNRSSLKAVECAEETVPASKEQDFTIYSFRQLDDAADASVRLYECFQGRSALYKEENAYFLVLHNDTPMLSPAPSMRELEEVLSEYGWKHAPSPLSEYYLSEHGEILIHHNAVQILAENLG